MTIDPETRRKILVRAAELVETGWARGAYARDEKGDAVFYDTPAAKCFCAVGAIARATFEALPVAKMSHRTEVKEVLGEEVRQHLGLMVHLTDWNDSDQRCAADVAAALRGAAETP